MSCGVNTNCDDLTSDTYAKWISEYPNYKIAAELSFIEACLEIENINESSIIDLLLNRESIIVGEIVKRFKSKFPVKASLVLIKRETGIEPATFSLARRRSTTEPLAHLRRLTQLVI